MAADTEKQKEALDKQLEYFLEAIGNFNIKAPVKKSEPDHIDLAEACYLLEKAKRKKRKKFDLTEFLTPLASPGDDPHGYNVVSATWEKQPTPEPPEKRFKASQTIGDRGTKVGDRGSEKNRASQGSTTRRGGTGKKAGSGLGGTRRRRRKKEGFDY